MTLCDDPSSPGFAPNPGPQQLLRLRPEALVLITDETHPLYDRRVHDPLSDALTLAIAELQAVQQPVHVREENGAWLVSDGRQRVRAARFINRTIDQGDTMSHIYRTFGHLSDEAARRLFEAIAALEHALWVPCMEVLGESRHALLASLVGNFSRVHETIGSMADKVVRSLESGSTVQELSAVMHHSVEAIEALSRWGQLHPDSQAFLAPRRHGLGMMTALLDVPTDAQPPIIEAALASRVRTEGQLRVLISDMRPRPDDGPSLAGSQQPSHPPSNRSAARSASRRGRARVLTRAELVRWLEQLEDSGETSVEAQAVTHAVRGMLGRLEGLKKLLPSSCWPPTR